MRCGSRVLFLAGAARERQGSSAVSTIAQIVAFRVGFGRSPELRRVSDPQSTVGRVGQEMETPYCQVGYVLRSRRPPMGWRIYDWLGDRGLPWATAATHLMGSVPPASSFGPGEKEAA